MMRTYHAVSQGSNWTRNERARRFEFGEGVTHAEDRCVRAHPALFLSGAAGAAAGAHYGSQPARLLPRGRLLLRSGADRPGREVAQDRAVRRLRTGPGACRAAT